MDFRIDYFYKFSRLITTTTKKRFNKKTEKKNNRNWTYFICDWFGGYYCIHMLWFSHESKHYLVWKQTGESQVKNIIQSTIIHMVHTDLHTPNFVCANSWHIMWCDWLCIGYFLRVLYRARLVIRIKRVEKRTIRVNEWAATEHTLTTVYVVVVVVFFLMWMGANRALQESISSWLCDDFRPHFFLSYITELEFFFL